MESSVRHWEISAAVMEPFMSCLLARIRTAAFCRSCVQTKGSRLIVLPFAINSYLKGGNHKNVPMLTFIGRVETKRMLPRHLREQRTARSVEYLRQLVTYAS